MIPILIREYGSDAIYTNHVLSLLCKLVLREEENITTVKLEYKTDASGKRVLVYSHADFEQACTMFMTKKDSHWHVKDKYKISQADMDAALVRRNKMKVQQKENKDAFLDHVLDIFYGSSTSGNSSGAGNESGSGSGGN